MRRPLFPIAEYRNAIKLIPVKERNRQILKLVHINHVNLHHAKRQEGSCI